MPLTVTPTPASYWQWNKSIIQMFGPAGSSPSPQLHAPSHPPQVVIIKTWLWQTKNRFNNLPPTNRNADEWILRWFLPEVKLTQTPNKYRSGMILISPTPPPPECIFSTRNETHYSRYIQPDATYSRSHVSWIWRSSLYAARMFGH